MHNTRPIKTKIARLITGTLLGDIHTDLPGGYGVFHSSFPGLSQIVGSGGSVRARMGEDQSVSVAEVEVSPAGGQRRSGRVPAEWFPNKIR
jgi:hypothetical protein